MPTSLLPNAIVKQAQTAPQIGPKSAPQSKRDDPPPKFEDVLSSARRRGDAKDEKPAAGAAPNRPTSAKSVKRAEKKNRGKPAQKADSPQQAAENVEQESTSPAEDPTVPRTDSDEVAAAEAALVKLANGEPAEKAPEIPEAQPAPSAVAATQISLARCDESVDDEAAAGEPQPTPVAVRRLGSRQESTEPSSNSDTAASAAQEADDSTAPKRAAATESRDAPDPQAAAPTRPQETSVKTTESLLPSAIGEAETAEDVTANRTKPASAARDEAPNDSTSVASAHANAVDADQPKSAASGLPESQAPPILPTVDPLPAKAVTAPQAGAAPAPAAPPTGPEVDFVSTNQATIVSAVRGELLPGGGTMQIRLDPPELGALQISVRMLDGVMTASFHTSSDEATKLLSHSLSQLKTVLETQGVSVDKLHVQQSPRDEKGGNGDTNPHNQHGQDDQASARHEQQRKEMLRRMWRRLSVGSDPLDMVA